MFLPNARPLPPRPHNEPMLSYAPGSAERAALVETLGRLGAERHELPLTIAGQKVQPGKVSDCRSPQRHQRILGHIHEGGIAELDRAIGAARNAWHDWSRSQWSSRAAIFLRAAELVSGKYRQVLNAATLLGQGKTAWQAEVDAACELADFLRFNVWYASQIYGEQLECPPGTWNVLEQRPLEGFVLAISPFNFTAIGGNLPSAPALMGNTVVWKPSPLAAFSNHFVMQIFEEAGLPPGVINLVQGPAPELVRHALEQHDLAGVHFTGSTEVFQNIWQQIGQRIGSYRAYPRIVGETGGKDFIVAHPSADPAAVTTAIIRAGYEYSGQKCSACSRAYLPASMWKAIEKKFCDEINGIAMGDPEELSNFTGALINEASFKRLEAAIGQAKADPRTTVLAGGAVDRSVGWYVRPTLVKTDDPRHDLMQRELFGPLVTLYVYPDAEWVKTLELINDTSSYALTGAVMASDRRAIDLAHDRLRHAAGNFYVNDKCTGAVVGQQPFGGSRQSGTNDKSGAPQNLLRWTQARTIKEVFAPPTDYRYPHMRKA